MELVRQGCYRPDCAAGVERLCPVCQWWICNDVRHVVEQHGRCASSYGERLRGQGQRLTRRPGGG